MSAREQVYFNSTSNTLEPMPSSGGTPANTAASVTDLNAKAAKSVQLTGTLTSAGWTGSSAPYTQTVTITGITAAMNGLVGLTQSATQAQFKAAANAAMRPTAQGVDSITITAEGTKPTINLPITVTVWY
jgi:hypothetical protein